MAKRDFLPKAINNNATNKKKFKHFPPISSQQTTNNTNKSKIRNKMKSEIRNTKNENRKVISV